MSLFCEFPNKRIQMAVLDLLFVYGSGWSASTVTDPQTPINSEIPLSRTD